MLRALLIYGCDWDDHVDDYHDVAAACEGIHFELILSGPTAQGLCNAYNCRLNLLNELNNVIIENTRSNNVTDELM